MQYENSMNAKAQEKLLQKISRRERIQITSGGHRRTSFSLLVIYGFVSLVTISFSLYRHGVTWKLIGFSAVFAMLFFPLYLICKRMADIAVKGDVLLVNQFSLPCKVTPIKSVSKIKTTHLLRFSITRLTFSLDGRKRKVLLINKSGRKRNKPESIIRFIMEAA